MDLIHLTCRKCHRKLRVKSDRAGQKIKCPKCEAMIPVRGGTSPAEGAKQQTHGTSRFQALATKLAAKGRPTAPASASTATQTRLSMRKYRKLIQVFQMEGLLTAETIRARAEVLRALGQSQDPRAYEWLTTDLDHRELPIRQAAAVGLGEFGDKRAVPLLVAMLDDPSMVMRKAAILSLGKLNDPRAVKPLLLFGLENPEMKFVASEAILEMNAEAVQTLIELLNDGEPGLVLEAIVLLGRIKDPRARRALTMMMESQRPLLQCHAIEALGQLADPKTIGSLARLLNAPEANVRTMAAAALAKMSSEKNTVAPLVKALNDRDEDVIIQAARGLGESGDKRAAEPLSRLLRSPAERVRQAAAVAMGHLGDSRAVPHLLPMLDAENEEEPLKALAALRAVKDPQAAGSLLRRLDHPNPTIRRRLVDVLGTIGDAEVAERLEHLLKSDPVSEVRMAAARALGEIADPASVDALKHALHKEEFNVRCQVVGALGRIGDEESYNILLPLLGDQVSEIRYHAASALGDVGNERAVPILKDLLKDKNALVVRGAAKALEKLGLTDVDALARKAQRSQRMKALAELGLTIKSWWPDSTGRQKVLFGGSLVAVMLVGLVGWLVSGLFAEAPARVIVRGNVQSLAFTDDGTQIAVGRTLGLVEVWTIPSESIAETLTPTDGSKVTRFVSPESLALAGGSGIQLWKKSQDNPPPAAGHSKPITRLTITPDHKLAATLSADGQVMLWDLMTGQPRATLRLPVTETMGFAVSADGTWVASANLRGQITVRNITTGEKVSQLPGSNAVTAISFHPDGKTLAVAYPDQVVIWNSETRARIATLNEGRGLTRLQYDPQGVQLVGLRGAVLTFWNTATFDETPAPPKTITVPADQIDACVFSRDGSQLAVGGTEDSAVWIYKAATGQLLKRLDTKP